MSSRMLTTIEAPTAFPLIEMAPASARLCRPIGFVAFTVTPAVDVRRDRFPTDAVVSKSMNCTAMEPATLAFDLPPAAAMPHTMKLFC